MSTSAGGVVRSIVERFTATTEKALHAFDRESAESQEFLRRLLKNLPGMAYRCRNDANWTMEFVSHGCRALTGFEAQDLVESRVVSYASLIHPEDRQRVWDSVQDAVFEGRSFQITYRIRRVDGRERTVWEQGCPVVGNGREVLAIEGFVTDITDHADLASRVKDHESQFKALVDQSLVGVYIVRGGRFEYVNPRFAEIFGYSTDEILSFPSVAELVHPDDRATVLENLRRRVDGETSQLRYDFRAQRKDGAELTVEVHGRGIELDGSRAVMGTLLDVTQRKRAERRYHEAQKLEALGRLATGVAHDLNNFLSVIKTTAELLMVERAADEALSDDLEGIVSAVERGTALSRQLTAFGRTRPEAGSTVSLARLVEDMVPLLRRVLGKSIEVHVTMEPDLPDVTIDPTRAEEIIMNLVLNARDAMPDGGELVVRVRSGAAVAQRSPKPERDTQRVVLEVADTGVGIAPEIRRKLFEPYFSTKGQKGTGLGLANVWRIANDAGGVVEVESELGSGSTFRVLLPVADAAA